MASGLTIDRRRFLGLELAGVSLAGLPHDGWVQAVRAHQAGRP